MDSLSPDRLKEFNFIKVFFKILLGFLALVILGLWLLRINDTAPLLKGELIASTAQRDYKTAFEAIPLKIFVQEGQAVKVGDTLAILKNLDIDNALQLKQSESALQNALALANNSSVENIEAQLNLLQKQKQQLTTQYQLQQAIISSQQESQKDLLILLSKKEKIAKENLARDSQLYENKLISLEGLKENRRAYLDEREKLLREQNQQKQLDNDLKLLASTFDQSKQDLALQINRQEASLNQIKEQGINRKAKIDQADTGLDYFQQAQQQLCIIADIDGVINFRFDLNEQSNFINKNELLFSIAPKNGDFIIKAFVEEREIKFIQTGQQVNLKLDAYDYYQHGILKGKVQHIPDRRQQDDFYILIQLEDYQRDFELKSGYSVRGEVILGEFRLYQYIVKKLFEQ